MHMHTDIHGHLRRTTEEAHTRTQTSSCMKPQDRLWRHSTTYHSANFIAVSTDGIKNGGSSSWVLSPIKQKTHEIQTFEYKQKEEKWAKIKKMSKNTSAREYGSTASPQRLRWFAGGKRDFSLLKDELESLESVRCDNSGSKARQGGNQKEEGRLKCSGTRWTSNGVCHEANNERHQRNRMWERRRKREWLP